MVVGRNMLWQTYEFNGTALLLARRDLKYFALTKIDSKKKTAAGEAMKKKI